MSCAGKKFTPRRLVIVAQDSHLVGGFFDRFLPPTLFPAAVRPGCWRGLSCRCGSILGVPSQYSDPKTLRWGVTTTAGFAVMLEKAWIRTISDSGAANMTKSTLSAHRSRSCG